jgi:hypothetical protein
MHKIVLHNGDSLSFEQGALNIAEAPGATYLDLAGNTIFYPYSSIRCIIQTPQEVPKEILADEGNDQHVPVVSDDTLEATYDIHILDTPVDIDSGQSEDTVATPD